MTNKKYNIEELAKKIGVSKTLVSFVLNNKADKYGVSKATQKKVMAAIKKLGFHPSFSARMLRLKKSNLIGLVVADIGNPFYAQIAKQIEQLADKAGYRIIIANTHENPKKEIDLLNALIHSQGVDGVILTSSLKSPASLKAIMPEKYPLVLLDRKLTGVPASCVAIDNLKGAADMTAHLLENGAKKIGLLTISPGYISPIKDRVTGYKKAIEKAGIKTDAELIREISFENMEEDVLEAVNFLCAKKEIDALFVLNNQIAKACLQVFEKLGIAIKADILFASFDDNDLFSLYKPSITAVTQPVEKLGEKAFEELMELIGQKSSGEKSLHGQISLIPELVKRQSSSK
ncbi:MAG TPA: LacI family DNA-binding transcriptional regulator [Bacteroidia bacterium]|nr:LacI family DNA-binding transcriptional regulator [Bacteroidia bacterium]